MTKILHLNRALADSHDNHTQMHEYQNLPIQKSFYQYLQLQTISLCVRTGRRNQTQPDLTTYKKVLADSGTT